MNKFPLKKDQVGYKLAKELFDKMTELLKQGKKNEPKTR